MDKKLDNYAKMVQQTKPVQLKNDTAIQNYRAKQKRFS